MVVFTCNHCGDSLQKPKVEKHYQVACRRTKSLTCVDCFTDFHGDDYNVHTKCITEQERYAAKGSLPNGVVKKGEVKQESWLDMIRSILDKEQNLSPKLKSLLETISEYNNVPRKKHKFMNFIKSSSGGRVDMKIVEDVWNVIEKYKSEIAKPDPAVKKEEKEEENNAKRKLDDKEEEVPKKKIKGSDENGVSEADVSMTKENDDEKITKKKKKSKKNINGTATENENKSSEADTNVNEDDGTGEQMTKKKKKKGKKENKEMTEEENGEESVNKMDVESSIADNSVNGKEDTLTNKNQEDDTPKKKKKKAKKGTEKSDVETISNTNDKADAEKTTANISVNGKETTPINEVQDEESPKKKKKKGKKGMEISQEDNLNVEQNANIDSNTIDKVDVEKRIDDDSVNGKEDPLMNKDQNEESPKKKKKKSKKENSKENNMDIEQNEEFDTKTNGKEIISNNAVDKNKPSTPKKKKKVDSGKSNVDTEVNGINKETEDKENGNDKEVEKSADDTMEVDDGNKTLDNDFSFEDAITNIMTKKKTMSLKKLQTKVLNAYMKHTGQSEVTPKNIKKFNKKLHKTKTIKVELDNVIFIE